MNFIQKTVCKVFGIDVPIPVSYYQTKVINFALARASYGKTVLVGDSITEAWNTTKFLNSNILNYGISGDTTTGVLMRVEQIINARPKSVILNIGINDISNKNPSLVSNYNTIVERLSQEIIPSKIICCAARPINYGFPLIKPNYSSNLPVRIFNAEVENIANKYGCVFEPLTYSIHIVSWQPDEVLNLEHTYDGIHMTSVGYEVEYVVMKKYFEDTPN